MLVAKRFGNSQDLIRLFQQELDRFPLRRGWFRAQRALHSEFGGIMIRPPDEQKNRLTHFVFPETVMSFAASGANSPLTGRTDGFLPYSELSATSKGELIVSIVSRRGHDGGQPPATTYARERDVVFSRPLWYFYGEQLESELRSFGLRHDMEPREWAERIAAHDRCRVELLQIDGRAVPVRTLPLPMNSQGCWGDPHSMMLAPEFTVYALHANQYTESEGFYEVASAHVHPTSNSAGAGSLTEQIAARVGERTVLMTVSPNDVRCARTSTASFNQILTGTGRPAKDTGETAMSIIGVDAAGQVVGIQHHDFGFIDDLEAMRSLNDRTLASMQSGKPDIGLVVAHYEYFSSTDVAASELGDKIGPHIGDR